MDTGATAWVLTSAALVLLMTPGLALFYGGMVRMKSVLNMMMMSLGALALISVLWVLYGYSVAFGNDVGAGLLGNPGEFLGLKGLMADTTTEAGGLPAMAFVGFQAVFAIITVALISGAIADRAKFGAWMVFAGVWATVIYFPIAHWVFDFTITDDSGVVTHTGGWIANNLKAIDFAGGTAVHINAGAAGLALALVLGKRHGWPHTPMKPHNLPLVLLGAGLLWFGWFGFNAGSALEANNSAVLAFMNTFLATACAVLAWTFGEWMFKGKPSMLGAASGAVAGLVAITPAAGNVGIPGAFVIGTLAGLVCLWGVNGLKHMLKVDDSLDVFGVHAVGGILGALLTGIFVSPDLGGPGFVTDWVTGKTGYTSYGEQLLIQAKAVGLTVVWSGVVAYVCYKIVDMVVGLRVPEEQEREGLDISSHGESAYRS